MDRVMGFEPTTSASIRQHHKLLVKSLFKSYPLRFDVLKVVLCVMVNSVVAKRDISNRREILILFLITTIMTP
ncbi:MAG: hypothetical protein M3275_16460 [Thermoproteota archaeon]|jgi:hypothetical protein|nr:hypothetical protein [Thermoproteota archaeon]